ncbi:MAG: CopD family protein [Chromatiales bacterium]|jgi:protoporphyrinogen IX oxidase|nr:CopD family protein [Chromatiales bacterium]
MAWVKAFHIIFVVSWYAGLLYLPRLFVYHAVCEDEPGHQRFLVMERKLFAIMTIGALGSVALGSWLLVDYAWAAWGDTAWLHAKLALVVTLMLYHAWCARVIALFKGRRNRRGDRFYRWINEVPALILIAIVILAVVKPS